MKISLTNSIKLLSTSMVVAVAAVLAAQSPVNAVTAQLAQANLQTDLTNITNELTKRSEELKKVTVSLNGTIGTPPTGDTKSTDTKFTLGTDSKECAEGDAKTKQAIDKTNKDSEKANTDIQALLSKAKEAKTADATKKVATDTDTQFDQFKTANVQANIMNTVCTQKEAQTQLEDLIKQAQDKESEASEGGGDTGNMQEIIQKIIQLVAAAAAIIASVVALVMAIQAGDYAAAATIFITIVGQLAAVAEVLLGAEGQITSVIDSLVSITASIGDDPNVGPNGDRNIH